MGNKLKVIITLVLIVLLGGVLTLYNYMESNSTAKHTQNTNSQQTEKTDDKIQKQIDALYFDEKKDFLVTDISADKIKELNEQVDKLNEATLVKEEYLEEISVLQDRFEAQSAVNKLYQGKQAAINGNQVKDDLAYNEDLTAEKVKKVKQEHYFMNDSEESISESTGDGGNRQALDKFQQAINQLIDQAENDMNADKILSEGIKKIEDIEILDGNIGQIAQAMADFDDELEKIKDTLPDLYKEYDQKAQKYTDLFVEKVVEISKTVPQYYNLLLIAVEPSQRLTAALEDNFDLFTVEETTTTEEESTIEETVTTIETTSNDYYYDDTPDDDWTDPGDPWIDPEPDPVETTHTETPPFTETT
ncbi:hypothetical protein HZY91_06280 [Facklamia sp. DSM 111018]|uniref:MapZ extracellular domain-containing protein n=1 Tax=Facklamia lactis TaxID=2749967 RepID=A0ABS0LQR8_9LACT|nr:hypothetical protein [Facklamia lactis]MBG9980687.1 hypothetical protein [Facklamia lactis]MBG9986501.1 hypothetical protein [Facklamia lactis]